MEGVSPHKFNKQSNGRVTMITAVDTNILLDVLGMDPLHYEKSSSLLERHDQEGSLIISPVVYSEILVFFLRKEKKEHALLKLKEFLNDMNVEIIPFSQQDFILASEMWNSALKTKEVHCPACGVLNTFLCKKCKNQVTWRNHILTDFLVGAHAQNHANVLATRDRGYYKKYFDIMIQEE